MKKILTILLLIFLLAIGALFGLNLWFKSYIKTPAFQQKLNEITLDRFNHQIKLKSIDYSLTNFSIHINGLTMIHPQKQIPILTFKALQLKLNPINLNIKTLLLDSPSINIVQNPDGTYNFQELIPKQTQTEKQKKKPQKSPSLPIEIQYLNISNAKISHTTIQNGSTERTFTIPDLSLTMTNVSLSKPLMIELKTSIGKESSLQTKTELTSIRDLFQDPSHFFINTQGHIDWQIHDFTPLFPTLSQKLPITQTQLSWQGKGNLLNGITLETHTKTPELTENNTINLKNNTKIQLNLNEKYRKNRLQLEDLARNPLQTMDLIILTQNNEIKLKTQELPLLTINCPLIEINETNDQLKINDLSISFSNTTLQLNGRGENLIHQLKNQNAQPPSSTPHLDLNLNGNQLIWEEIEKYIPQTKKQEPSSKTPETEKAPQSTSPLKNIIINITSSLQKLTYEDYQLTNLKLKAGLKKGIITIDPLQAEAYEGQINGKGQINLLETPITYNLDLRTDSINLHPIFYKTKQTGYYGNLFTEFQISGQGTTAQNLKENLSLKGNISIKNAKKISKGNLLDPLYINLNNPILLDLFPGLKEEITEAEKRTQEPTITEIKDLTSSFQSQNDKLHLSSLALGTKDYFIKADGTVNPFENSMDLNAHLYLSEEKTKKLTKNRDYSDLLPYKEGGLIIPLKIKGNFDSPQLYPDVSALIKIALAKKTQEKLDQLGQLFKNEKKYTPTTQKEPSPLEELGKQLLQDLFTKKTD